MARIKRRSVLASHSPEICNSWDWLPEGILREITVRQDLCSIKATRLVCARWHPYLQLECRSSLYSLLLKSKVYSKSDGCARPQT